MKTRTVLVVSGVAISVCALVLFAGLSKEPETYKEIFAPDNHFKVIIVTKKRGIPYGVEGAIFRSDVDGMNRKKILDFFEDAIGDVERKMRWNETKGGFEYLGLRYKTYLIK